jgi:hypothetical protein
MFEGGSFGETPPSAEAMLGRAFRFLREQGPLSRLLLLSADPSSQKTARQASRAQIVGALSRAFAEWSRRPGASDGSADRRGAAFALVEAALTECFVRHGGAREEDYPRGRALREGAVLPRPDLPRTPRRGDEHEPTLPRRRSVPARQLRPWPMEGEIQDSS